MKPTKQFRFKDGKLQQAFVFNDDDVWLADQFHIEHIDDDVFKGHDGLFSKWLEDACCWVDIQSID